MKVEKSIVIARPVEKVFAFVTQMENVKRWLPVTEVQALSNGPLGVGSRFRQSGEFMGQHFEGAIEVTRYEPSHAFSFKLVDGPFPLSNDMTFDAVPGGTRLTLVGEADPGSKLKFAGPFLMPMVRKQLDTQVNTLKRVIESE
ncbi:SRPBCC family protein [Tengunoibacter tsumagoiensis]|uniref:ATPase n=1 Tax=Tengunoibacter tsumagoiensis TaxID=2014871 RepID=A0A402A3H5_9CHLR|nr:SRPBCC family protein [Tengunoibacter tsumagoiensis]GCE13694.1 ATPase [Tengunoibacter tsumagoiensis]